MRKKIIKAAAVIIGLSTAAAVIYYHLPQPANQFTNDKVLVFDDKRDTQAILNIFKDDWYWLVSSDDYSPEFMLKNRAPNKDPRYFGKLNIRVLYDQDNFVGFICYYMKNFFIGQILFIDVKKEFRGKGFAQHLMKYAIADLKKQGATMITLVTRTSNLDAQRVYKKLGFTTMLEEDGFVYFELRP